MQRLTGMRGRALGAALGALTALPVAHAQVLVAETRLVGQGGVRPFELPLAVPAAGAYVVDLRDLAAPVALAGVDAIVTSGADTLGAPATAAGPIAFTTAGAANATLRILGTPAAAPATAGTVGGCLRRASDPATCPGLVDFANTFQRVPAAGSVATFEVDVAIPEAGSYTVTIADHALPATLGSLQGRLFLGATTVGPVLPVGTTTVTGLVAGTYSLKVVAAPASGQPAGLYGVRITGGPSGATVYDRTIPVGPLEAPVAIAALPAGAGSLRLTDFGLPAALARAGAALTQGGRRLAGLGAAGSAAFTGSAGAAELWTFVQGAAAAAGTYGLDVTVGASRVFGTTTSVPASGATPTSAAFAVPLTVPAVGTVTFRVTDFQFPSTATGVQFAVAQGSTILAQKTDGPGTLDVALAPGEATLLLTVATSAGVRNLLGVRATTAGGTVLLDDTRAVGTAFQTRRVDVATAGRYDATARDAGFPGPFTEFAAAVSRGGDLVGRIFGAGTIAFDATPGAYVVTLLATPGAKGYGLYALAVGASAPTAALAASPASVASGGTVRLEWSSTGATRCTASDGWSGTKSTAGSETSPALTGATTFRLTCTGPGGSATAQAAVSVSGATGGGSGSSGGGGALDALALLAGLAALAARGRAAVRGAARA